MTLTNSFPDIRCMLTRLGYHETSLNAIMQELETLFKEIDFDKLKLAVNTAQESKDTNLLISSLKELMQLLENKGYYRPDFPTKLIRLLVNGINCKNEDIFVVLDKAGIPAKEKRKEQEFLASCAAITQLGYILINCMISEVKAASAGQHVFIMTDGFSAGSMIFVDFSIDSIIEIDMQRYNRKENCYSLKSSGNPEEEIANLLNDYYSFFQVTSGIGLSHNIHNNLGITYDRLGRYEEAVSELNEALRLNPGYVEVHNNLAVTYDKLGKRDEAVRELQEALRLNPGYTEAHNNLGNVYAGEGRYEEAIKELEEAIRINPGYAVAHNNLGNIYALQNRLTEALKEFQEALRLNPDYTIARSNLGNIYADMGRHEDALKEFQEVLRLDPEFPDAYHGIGSVYYSLGSYDKSANAWARAVYLDSGLLDSVPEKLLLKVRQGVSRLRG